MSISSREREVRWSWSGSLDGTARAAKRMFLVGWLFFGVVALIGFLLRMQFVVPLSGFSYGNFLHAHSHVAFLGWIYNAFFALAVHFFVPPEKVGGYWRLFLVTQLSVVGILISFPLQGYAGASILFSTMHMICAAVFIWKLLQANTAGPVARHFLWAACGFMLGSSLGPLALGPVMVAGLADTVWYGLSIGFYLHFQYNGWFIFFLLAVLYQAMYQRGIEVSRFAAGRAFFWLTAGCVFTFSLSVLPMAPGGWIFVIVAVGGVAQFIGCGYWISSIRGATGIFRGPHSNLIRWLAMAVASLFVLKMVLQGLAAWPGLVNLATNHFTIIAFMHLIFLGIVTPMLVAWAIDLGWIRPGMMAKTGLLALGSGALLSELALGYTPLAGAFRWGAWPWFGETQLLGASLIFVGVVMIGIGRSGSAGRGLPAGAN